MLLCVYPIQATAQAISDAADLALGYPKPGLDVGAGDHAPPSQSQTLHLSYVIKHPTLLQWGYVVDSVPVAILSQVGAVLPITATAAWLPTPV